MPLDLILHVGLPKTGTKSIQSALIASKAELASRGVFVPAAVGDEPGQHAPILREVVGCQRWEDDIAWSRDSLSLGRVLEDVASEGANTLVLSSESFSLLADDTASLVDAIEPDSLHLVSFVRSPVAWVESARSEVLRTGNPWGIDVDLMGFVNSSEGLDRWRRLTQLFHKLRNGPRTTSITLGVLMDRPSSLSLFSQAVGLTLVPRGKTSLNRRMSACDQRLAYAIATAALRNPRPRHLYNLRLEAIRNRLGAPHADSAKCDCASLIDPQHAATVVAEAEVIRSQLVTLSDRVVGFDRDFPPATAEERRTFRSPSVETWEQAGQALFGALDDLIDREAAAQEARDFWYARRAGAAEKT